MTAYTLSKNGFDVLLVDRKKEIGLPVRCAEGISHSAFEDSGLRPSEDWIEQEVKGIKFLASEGKPFHCRGRGYSIDRHGFDRWIVNKALDAGCNLKLRTNARTVSYDGKLWTIRTNSSNEKSRILIAADGPLSNTAKSLGMLRKRVWANGMQYKIDARDFDHDEGDWLCFYLSERFKGGFGWVFPRGDEFNVGCGTFGEVRRMLRAFCKTLNVDCEKTRGTNAGIVPHGYDLSSYASRGLAIVGDSAGLTNPASGSGIRAALVSGRMAGESACKALQLENPNIMLDYHKKISRSKYVSPRFMKCANVLKKWGDDEFNFLLKALDGGEYGKSSTIGVNKMLLQNPRYLRRAGELWTIKKALGLILKYGW